jgi:hypothetical protein
MYYFTILGGQSQRSLKQYFQPTHAAQLKTIPGIWTWWPSSNDPGDARRCSATRLKHGYAVAGVVCLGWEDMRAFVTAAEAERAPIILQAGPGCREHTPLPILARMFRHLAEMRLFRSWPISIMAIRLTNAGGDCRRASRP